MKLRQFDNSVNNFLDIQNTRYLFCFLSSHFNFLFYYTTKTKFIKSGYFGARIIRNGLLKNN